MLNNKSQDAGKELSVGLLRQRRNLILISMIMPLFFLSGASVNQINLFGTVIYLESQSGIKVVMFVMYFYFLWRYLQYYYEEERAKVFRSIRDKRLYEIEFDYFSDIMRSKADCFEFHHYYPCFKRKDAPMVEMVRTLPDKRMDKKIGLFRKSRIMEIYGLDDKYEDHYLKSGEEQTKISDDELKKIDKYWRLVKKEVSDARSGAIFETDVEYNSLHLWLVRFLGNFKFLVVHPYFTDYRLPFLIAGVSFVSTIAYI